LRLAWAKYKTLSQEKRKVGRARMEKEGGGRKGKDKKKKKNTLVLDLKFFYFCFIIFYIYSHVYTLFEPTPHSPASRKNLFCPLFSHFVEEKT
jgi:hypothetical protein